MASAAQKPKITKVTKKTPAKKAPVKKPKTPEPEIEIPYLFPRTEVRKGTYDWPYLYSICKTKSSPGRVSTKLILLKVISAKSSKVSL